MPTTSLVTGANGHLGNNLVRRLLGRGERVVAGIRNPKYRAALENLGCTTAQVDLLDRASLPRALAGVDVVYQVGAVFKHWARDPERDIYTANLNATRNILEAAAQAGVRRLVYVSSLAALDRSRPPVTESGRNPDRSNVYFRSKTDSEKLAWELAAKYGLDLVSVLPGAMIGKNCLTPTPTMALLKSVLDGALPVNPGFFFNFIDVEDVAEGCHVVARSGKFGERYLLANERCTSIAELVRLAQAQFPERNIATPAKPPRLAITVAASVLEFVGRLTRREPMLQRNFLQAFTVPEHCDISKARRELGFRPRSPEESIASAFRYLAADEPRGDRAVTGSEL
jgi:dihydroflavonol-4-reductase